MQELIDAIQERLNRLTPGRYVCVDREHIEQGGQALVLRFEDTVLHRAVFLKTPRPFGWDPAGQQQALMARKRLHAEAIYMQTLRERGADICPAIINADLRDEPPFIVIEKARGVRLDQFAGTVGIRLEKPNAIAKVKPIARAILVALAKLHQAGVVHRDLKFENIFVAPEIGGKGYQVQFIDFGLAKEIPNHAAGAALPADIQVASMAGEFLGTPEYSPPERIRVALKAQRGAEIYGDTMAQLYNDPDRASGDPAIDLYGAGGLFYRMITGFFPFHDQIDDSRLDAWARQRVWERESREPTPQELAAQKRWGRATYAAESGLQVTPIGQLWPLNSPEEIADADLFMNMVHYDPDKRMSALELLKWLEGKKGSGHEVSTVRKAISVATPISTRSVAKPAAKAPAKAPPATRAWYAVGAVLLLFVVLGVVAGVVPKLTTAPAEEVNGATSPSAADAKKPVVAGVSPRSGEELVAGERGLWQAQVADGRQAQAWSWRFNAGKPEDGGPTLVEIVPDVESLTVEVRVEADGMFSEWRTATYPVRPPAPKSIALPTTGTVTALAVSPTSKWIAAAVDDRDGSANIYLWHAPSARLWARIDDVTTDEIWSLELGPNEDLVWLAATAQSGFGVTRDYTGYLWNIRAENVRVERPVDGFVYFRSNELDCYYEFVPSAVGREMRRVQLDRSPRDAREKGLPNPLTEAGATVISLSTSEDRFVVLDEPGEEQRDQVMFSINQYSITNADAKGSPYFEWSERLVNPEGAKTVPTRWVTAEGPTLYFESTLPEGRTILEMHRYDGEHFAGDRLDAAASPRGGLANWSLSPAGDLLAEVRTAGSGYEVAVWDVAALPPKHLGNLVEPIAGSGVRFSFGGRYLTCVRQGQAGLEIQTVDLKNPASGVPAFATRRQLATAGALPSSP